jgi:hypothetical protein
MANRRRIRVQLTWMWPALLSAVVLILLSAGAAAAIETNTVSSYWSGLWWSISLITTVGFIGEPPETVPGAVLSAALMVLGFLLLAMVSASLAALFVREDEQPRDTRELAADRRILDALELLERRLASIEHHLGARAAASSAPDQTSSESEGTGVDGDGPRRDV